MRRGKKTQYILYTEYEKVILLKFWILNTR